MTRAVRVVVRVVSRLVVPWPSSDDWPEAPARLAQGPAALVTPASAVTELLAFELRAVLVAPVAVAVDCSLTRIVTMSSTWLARRSRAPSASRDEGDHIEPGDASFASPGRAADSET